jgi:mRNA-degrading endonuclease HigB of HigAB toxin-antitoxin module
MIEKEKQTLPRILITAPQHESKMYSWDMWIENVKNFTYPKELIEIYIADNSFTKENVKKMIGYGVKAIHVKQNKKGIIHTINDSHEACRKYFLENDFDFMLHLETDIIPPIDVIERLINNNKRICAGAYDIFQGTKRKPMIQLDERFDKTIKAYRTPEYVREDEALFFNGNVNRVYHAGLGCVLIHKSILETLSFRVDSNYNMHTDTWFANDCYLINSNIFLDTTIQCKHYNQTWLGVIN